MRVYLRKYHMTLDPITLHSDLTHTTIKLARLSSRMDEIHPTWQKSDAISIAEIKEYVQGCVSNHYASEKSSKALKVFRARIERSGARICAWIV